MLSVFQRLWNLVKGRGHAVLNKWEKPDEQLSLFIEELSESIVKLQKSVASAVADEKKLKLQVEKMLETVNSWEQKAILALQGGDESLAKEALLRKEEYENQARALHLSWNTQKEASEKLKINLVQAKNRVEEAKRQYTLLMARYNAAKTQQKLTETLSPTSGDSSWKYIENLNDKILKIEAESEANLELIGVGGNSELEHKLNQLDKAHRGDQALIALKAKLGHHKQLEVFPIDK